MGRTHDPGLSLRCETALRSRPSRRGGRRYRSLRLTAGMSVLALMFVFYYFMDVGLQISSIRSNVLTPAVVTAPLP